MRYPGLDARQPYDDVMSPYLIEPSPWSDSVYVIGPSVSSRARPLVTIALEDRVAVNSSRGEDHLPDGNSGGLAV